MKAKFCRDCRYKEFKFGFTNSNDDCYAPSNYQVIGFNVVKGTVVKERKVRGALIARDSQQLCGREGKWFAPGIKYWLNWFRLPKRTPNG